MYSHLKNPGAARLCSPWIWERLALILRGSLCAVGLVKLSVCVGLLLPRGHWAGPSHSIY